MPEAIASFSLKARFAGGFLFLISVFWIYRNASIIYEYKIYPDLLRYIMIPEWILIFEIIIGLVGLAIGALIFNSRWKIKRGYLTFGVIWLIGMGIEYINITL